LTVPVVTGPINLLVSYLVSYLAVHGQRGFFNGFEIIRVLEFTFREGRAVCLFFADFGDLDSINRED
jgi:hypothetical protein